MLNFVACCKGGGICLVVITIAVDDKTMEPDSDNYHRTIAARTHGNRTLINPARLNP